MVTDSHHLSALSILINWILRRYVKWVVMMLTMLGCQTVNGQPTVTDIDMKSMYCVPIVLSTRNALDITFQIFQSSIPNSKLEDFKNELDRLDTDINRLRSYLLVRARIVGPTVYTQLVKVAENRGHADLAASKKCSDSCGDTTNQDGTPNFLKLDQCMSSCKKKNSEVFSRMESCNVINWLPF